MTSIQHIGMDGVNASFKGDEKKKPHSNKLNADDFMKLMIKSFTSQNPLKPTDNGAVMQQMAAMNTISSAEDTKVAIGELKQSINVMLGNSQFLGASQLVGKKVEVFNDKSLLVKDKGLSGSVWLTHPASNVKVTIKDKVGNIVKEVDLGSQKTTGLIHYDWDGMKEDKVTAYEPGEYTITATAIVDKQPMVMQTTGAYPVNSVSSNPKTGDVFINADIIGGLTFKDIIKIL